MVCICFSLNGFEGVNGLVTMYSMRMWSGMGKPYLTIHYQNPEITERTIIRRCARLFFQSLTSVTFRTSSSLSLSFVALPAFCPFVCVKLGQ